MFVVLTALACTNNPRTVTVFDDSMEASNLAVVDIETDSEHLVVAPSEGAEVSIEVDLVTTRTDTGRDGEATDALHLEMRDLGDGTARVTVWFDGNVSRYYTEVTVLVPPTLPVELSDEGGDIEVSGIASLSLVDGDGDADITGVLGHVDIEDGGGDLRIAEITGNVDIEDGAGDIEVRDIEGAVTITDGAGDIDVEGAVSVEIVEDGSGSASIRE